MERHDDDVWTIGQKFIELNTPFILMVNGVFNDAWSPPKPKAIVDRRRNPKKRRGHRRLA